MHMPVAIASARCKYYAPGAHVTPLPTLGPSQLLPARAPQPRATTMTIPVLVRPSGSILVRKEDPRSREQPPGRIRRRTSAAVAAVAVVAAGMHQVGHRVALYLVVRLFHRSEKACICEYSRIIVVGVIFFL